MGAKKGFINAGLVAVYTGAEVATSCAADGRATQCSTGDAAYWYVHASAPSVRVPRVCAH